MIAGLRPRAIIDGGTGYVGSNFIRYLTDQRPEIEVVALVRGHPSRLLRAVGESVVVDGTWNAPDLRVVEYLLTEPGLGVSDDIWKELFDTPCDYWHFAANVDLSENQPTMWDVNVGGSENTAEVFDRFASHDSRYFMVSTAYSGGRSDGAITERWHATRPTSAYRTYYEMTKQAAEDVVRTRLVDVGADASVFRLGQVVGSATTGRTTTTYGMYDILRAIRRLAGGKPRQRLRIAALTEGSLELIPVDTCVSWLLSLAARDQRADPPVYHLVDRQPVSIPALFEAFSAHLPATLVAIGEEAFRSLDSTSFLERVINNRLTYSGRYVRERIRFDRRHLSEALADPPRVVTDEVLDRLIRTFVTDHA